MNVAPGNSRSGGVGRGRLFLRHVGAHRGVVTEGWELAGGDFNVQVAGEKNWSRNGVTVGKNAAGAVIIDDEGDLNFVDLSYWHKINSLAFATVFLDSQIKKSQAFLGCGSLGF